MPEQRDNHKRQKQPPESRFEAFKRTARERWEDRPSLFELQYYHLPIAIVIGAFAIGTADEALGTGIAEQMAEVTVDKNEGALEQLWDGLVHEIGSAAVEMKD